LRSDGTHERSEGYGERVYERGGGPGDVVYEAGLYWYEEPHNFIWKGDED